MGYTITKQEYYVIIGVGSFSKADAVALRDALNAALGLVNAPMQYYTDAGGDVWAQQDDGAWHIKRWSDGSEHSRFNAGLTGFSLEELLHDWPGGTWS